jgi:hypothetical protein
MVYCPCECGIGSGSVACGVGSTRKSSGALPDNVRKSGRQGTTVYLDMEEVSNRCLKCFPLHPAQKLDGAAPHIIGATSISFIQQPDIFQSKKRSLSTDRTSQQTPLQVFDCMEFMASRSLKRGCQVGTSPLRAPELQ